MTNNDKLTDEEWLQKFEAEDRKKNPQDYLPPITYDEDNQGSSTKKININPIVIAIICGIVLLIVSLFILLKYEPSPEPTEVILFTDDYSVFSKPFSIRNEL